MKQQRKNMGYPNSKRRDERDYDTLLQITLDTDAECEQLRQDNATLRRKADFYDQVCRMRNRISNKVP